MYSWERRDKKRTKGRAFKFKKNGEQKLRNAHHRFSDEKLYDTLDEQKEYTDDELDMLMKQE